MKFIFVISLAVVTSFILSGCTFFVSPLMFIDNNQIPSDFIDVDNMQPQTQEYDLIA